MGFGTLDGMVRATASVTGVEKLAHRIFDHVEDPLADEVTRWLAGSGRFRAFVEANSDKIRKKLRGATDAEARRDVRMELRVAQRLLVDRRIEMAFEAYGSTTGGPDFTLTFRGERAFNIEVTRVRGVADGTIHAPPILAKLRQLPPSMPNAVLVALDGPRDDAQALDVAAATRALRARADAKDEAYFASRGFDGTRGFYRRYLRLGAVFVWREDASVGGRVTTWTNASARIALPERAARACVACLATSDDR